MHVTPSADALRLRALAAELLPRLSRRGRSSVAITGSAARGDAAAGSDLDLWLIGPHSDRQHLTVAGTPVTLLRTRPAEAFTLETLCLYEVADALVLADPRGHFARVQRAARRRAAEVRRAVLDATWDGLRADLRLLDGASDWQRTLALRHLAFRLAATSLYLRAGWRVPRLRALRLHLPAPARKTLERCLGLPVSAADARRAVRACARALEAVERQNGKWGQATFAEKVACPHFPRELEARLAAKEWDEAVVLARRFLRRDLLPPLLTALDFRDVQELSLVGPLAPVLDAVRRAEGLDARPRARSTAAAVARLAAQLELAPLLPADVRRRLKVSRRSERF